MSLIVYECQRAGHGHEIRQFSAAAQSLYDYFDGRDETALFIGNVNVGEANLDGLIIKNDAIIIVEFKVVKYSRLCLHKDIIFYDI